MGATGVGRLVAIAGAIVALAGCNVATRVEITMHDDGSGVVRTTVTLDADAVAQLGGSTGLAAAVPLSDLRTAGWSVSSWRAGTAGSESVTLSHAFSNQDELARRVVDLAGPNGMLRSPALRHDRGWLGSRDELSVVVDLRAPSVDIAHDATLAAWLRAAKVDPVRLQAQLSSQLRTALHVSVVLHVPGGDAKTFDVATGTVRTLRVAHDATDWDGVVKLGIGAALALLAGAFFVAALVGVRRNRRRAAQRVGAGAGRPDRAPLM